MCSLMVIAFQQFSVIPVQLKGEHGGPPRGYVKQGNNVIYFRGIQV